MPATCPKRKAANNRAQYIRTKQAIIDTEEVKNKAESEALALVRTERTKNLNMVRKMLKNADSSFAKKHSRP